MNDINRSLAKIDQSIEARAGNLRPADAASASKLTPLPLLYSEDIDARSVNLQQLVEDVLTQGGLSVMYGESNSGKSFLTAHLSCSVGRGSTWLGKRTVQGAVLYVAGEGSESIKLRIAAYKQQFRVQRLNVAVVPIAINLLESNADPLRVIRAAQAVAEHYGMPVRLIVIDTLARAFGGGNENAGEDMGAVIEHADLIRMQTGAAVLFVHHSGKDASKGSRGHSSLRAATDTEIEVTADQELRLHTAEITKQRDLSSKGQRITGKFEVVEMGRDQWGKPITTCVVLDTTETHEKPRSKGRVSPLQTAVLTAIRAAGKPMRREDIVACIKRTGTSENEMSIYNAIRKLIKDGKLSDPIHGLVTILDA